MAKKDEVKSTSKGRGLTPKQEKFCQLYIELGNASEAYRQAYNCSKMTEKTVNEEAIRLLNNPKITPRIEELKNTHQQRHNISIDKLLDRLDRIYQGSMAEKKPQYGVAITAVMSQARLLGLDAPHSVEVRKALVRKYQLEGDKITSELDNKNSADDKVQFIQEFD